MMTLAIGIASSDAELPSTPPAMRPRFLDTCGYALVYNDMESTRCRVWEEG